MAELPSATTRIDDTAATVAVGTKYVAILAAVPTSADSVPRVFGSSKAIYDLHGYSEGLEYAALHVQDTKLPVIFCGLPIATPGVVGRFDASGNTGTSVVSCAVGSSGSLAETDGVVTVVTGGTVGTDQIVLGISLDGGRTSQNVRIGTATSYTIPYVGLALGLTVGTLVADDEVLTWHSTAPMWDSAGLQAAREKLAAQTKQVRSFVVIGDLTDSTFAGYVTTQANAYETSNDRFVFARCSVRDRLPYSTLSDVQTRMTGAPNITFADVGAGNDTVTRSSGSFVSDGFVTGDTVRITGAVASGGANNVVGVVTVAAGVLTFPDAGIALVAEGPIAGVSITSEPTLTFAEAGDADTITRNRGSWLDDGFRAGDIITITGTASNNVTGPIATVTSSVITMTDATDLAAEVIGTHGVTITAGETKAQWIANSDSAFASVDAQKRIDLAAGRLRKLSPITQYLMRRPVSWAASIREYQHDVQIPCWRKADGPLDGWSLDDADGNLYEFDERIDAGALAARFTCARTWANGPVGAFIALSLTRATEASLLSRTHNMAVANVAQTVAQTEAENAIGQVLQLNSDGTATTESLNKIKERVNSALQKNLLQDTGEGPRASSATWTPAADDVLNVPGALLNAVLELNLNGTLEKIATTVRIQSGG
jgi:hypothetical protein